MRLESTDLNQQLESTTKMAFARIVPPSISETLDWKRSNSLPRPHSAKRPPTPYHPRLDPLPFPPAAHARAPPPPPACLAPPRFPPAAAPRAHTPSPCAGGSGAGGNRRGAKLAGYGVGGRFA